MRPRCCRKICQNQRASTCTHALTLLWSPSSHYGHENRVQIQKQRHTMEHISIKLLWFYFHLTVVMSFRPGRSVGQSVQIDFFSFTVHNSWYHSTSSLSSSHINILKTKCVDLFGRAKILFWLFFNINLGLGYSFHFIINS